MLTTSEMRTCNAFVQLMREGKVKLELELENELEETPIRFGIGMVFVFNDPEAPKDYTIMTKYDQDQVKLIRETLDDWLEKN